MAARSLLMIAGAGEVEALSAGTAMERWPSKCLEEVGIKEVELLRHAIDWRDGYQSDRSQVVVKGSNHGWVILRLSPMLAAYLVNVGSDEERVLASRWERSLADWDSCVQWPTQAALANAVAQLCLLARQAPSGENEIFWWLTPKAWAERLQLEQDFNCIELREGPFWRICFGKEATSTTTGDSPTCPYCHTRAGLFHLSGCCAEECPKCHGPVVVCRCERGVWVEDE